MFSCFSFCSLMAKFSKKLVSKCIYIQILKCTETELLGQFMAAGGWSLVHMWLADGITTKNWPLIQELLELLLCCPVDVERLKSNTAPKLVKTLSKDSSHEGKLDILTVFCSMLNMISLVLSRLKDWPFNRFHEESYAQLFRKLSI